MENGDEDLPSIILTGQGILVKMLITLVLIKFYILIHFNIIDLGMQNAD